VGPSGSGKTTIMNMIPRFFDVTDGAVLIEDKNIKDYSLNDLRSQIALVSQDITIFDDTAFANIAYGRSGASFEEVVAAAKAAEAHEFIENLPDGYETRLGEEGLRLSGGQRQRIAIARAILRDAPILLLDEATSALDNESERAIQNTLSKFQQGRTTLVIAHRLSTVQNADQILVLDQGHVVEHGKHDELMALDGVYARMHKAGFQE
ncbi:MAG: ATP-binding cassette domain-containing protein, partial [Pseudomonadota bacterium]